MSVTYTASSAEFSLCRTYRYWLHRRWSDGPNDLWCALNPSTADAELDDPSVRRMVGFSRRDGAGGLYLWNAYALRATDPAALWSHRDPVGETNDEVLRALARHARRVIVAWGANAEHARALLVWRALAGMAHGRVYCLGRTKSGAPRHPLYVRRDTPLEPWSPA